MGIGETIVELYGLIDMVRSTLLQGWVRAALKGESGGVTGICTARSTAVSNVSRVAGSISVLVSFLTRRFVLS